MMNSDGNLNYDHQDSAVGGHDDAEANYTVEESAPAGSGDWGNTSFPPPDEAVYHDEGPQDDRGYAEDAYDEHMEYDENEHEAYEDPYADTPYPEAYDDPYANTPYATDAGGEYVNDPYGEHDYSMKDINADDMEEVDMSHNDPENLHGGEYELESKDPKAGGWQAFMQRYGRAIATTASGLCFALVLVAVILVATAESGGSSLPHKADGSLSPWGRRHDEVHTGAFVTPPLALETTCTQENIQTQDGFDACSELCEPAQCCRFDPVAAPRMSCEREHAQDCHTYHHYCERPPKAAVIPYTPPPDDIKDVCVAEKMHTPEGVEACARACKGGTCCRFPTTLTGLSCLRGNEVECQIYHTYCEQPPSQDNSASEGVPLLSFPFVKPPEDIGEKCSASSVATAQGFEECLDVCRSGTCCKFHPDNEPSFSCRSDHPDDCPVYDQYCGGDADVISQSTPHPNGGTGISGDNPDAATYVEKVCSDHSLATVEGFADCERACEEHRCCWEKEFGTTCPAGTHCEPFAHCLAMEASDHFDVAIQVAINMKCTDELVATVEGRKDCLFACSQATCCFGKTAGECPHANDSFCNQYNACEKVVHESIPPAPPTLNEHCQRGNLGTLEGLAECDRACAHATCCWKESDNEPSCAKTNPLCEDYAACSILEEGVVAETTFPPVPAPPDDLVSQCSMAESSDMTDCEDSCKVAECCWKTGHCLHNQADRCEPYVPCAVLLDDIEDAPANLENTCTRSKVSTAAGAAACEDICEPAACCWRTGACLTTHGDQCQGYIPCAVLFSTDDSSLGSPGPLAEAPELLKETCTATSVATDDGEMLCADVCKPAECCWKYGTCLATQPDVCEGYVPCAVLMANDDDTDTLPAASGELENICTKDLVASVAGAAECHSQCDAAACCWKTGTCLATQPDICEGYVPCAVLVGEDTLPAAPDDLSSICTKELVTSVAGAEVCHAQCDVAECCWKTGSCLATEPDVCEGYVPCAVLVEDETIPEAPADLSSTCAEDLVASIAGAEACHEQCDAAECCWKTGSCLATQPDVCEGYVPCAVLVDEEDDNTLPAAPEDLWSICTNDLVATTAGSDACHAVCDVADCCWKTGSCLGTQPGICEGYVPCAVLVQEDTLPPAPANLSGVCTKDLVATAAGSDGCHSLCDVAECCWKTGSCLGTQPNVCEGYVPCAILVADDSNEIAPAPDNLEQKCQRDLVSTPDGWAGCNAACSAAECCWKTGSCLGIHPDTCEEYVACAILMEESIAAAPENITEVCSQVSTLAGMGACEALCNAADCCWKTGTCLSTQPETCEGYVPCAILMSNTDTAAPAPTGTVPWAPSFLSDVCTADKVKNEEGAILCQDACEAAECCWKTGSCLGEHPTQCEGYIPCAVLHENGIDEATLPAVPKVPTYLSTVCASEIAGDAVHGHLCVNACAQADCCWDSNSDESCTEDANCAGYEICSNVNFDTIIPPSPAPVATPAPQPGTSTTAATAAPQPDSSGAEDYSEEMITDACLNHDNSIVNLCSKVCEPSACCFDQSAEGGHSCAADFPCYKYSACATLYPDDDNYVDQQCSTGDTSDCLAVCGESSCCFTKDLNKTCSKTNPTIVCSRYTACEKLYQF